MNIKTLLSDIKKGNSTALAQGITLIESDLLSDWNKAKELIKKTSMPSQKSLRLGFSGPPGVGKSSFIEKIGLQLIGQGDSVAVLAIDPSSERTGGSILGDKTRMEELSRSERAFVRPSATRGHLGGVTSSLPGVIQLCEFAGYKWILVESVGVGQSEIELSRMVDLFTLLSQPGAGDELQGIKKGILEYVDLIVVNKMDRDPGLVNTTRQQYLAALKILRGKSVAVKACSALTGQGVSDVVQIFNDSLTDFDVKQRQHFFEHWFESLVYSEFKKSLKSPQYQSLFSVYSRKVGKKEILPIEATDLFLSDLGLSRDKTKV